MVSGCFIQAQLILSWIWAPFKPVRWAQAFCCFRKKRKKKIIIKLEDKHEKNTTNQINNSHRPLKIGPISKPDLVKRWADSLNWAHA